jgi:signal transduction histidine kinase
MPFPRIAAAVIRAGFLLCTLAAVSSHAAEPKRILMLNSFGDNTFPYSSVSTIFRATMLDAWPGQAAFYNFALEAGRPLDRNEAATVEVIRSRFANMKLDLVVALGPPAARFYGKYREALFPSVPLLMLSMDQRLAPVEYLRPGDSVVAIKLSPTRTLDDMLQLLPNTNTVAVVFGDSPGERAWIDELHSEFAPFENRVKFLWLTGLSLPELRERVATLRPGTVILYGLFLADAAGIPYEGDYPIGQLHAAASVPIFSFLSAEMGKGTVGGALISNTEEGVAGAKSASNMLRGESAQGVLKTLVEPATPQFDWRELQRWGIDESRLPPGSQVLFRPRSLWAENKPSILVVACLLVMQAALIAALYVELNRRRRAERESFSLSWRLLTAQEDERRRLARELHDDVTQRLASLAIDAARLESLKPRTHDSPSRSVHGGLVRLSEDVHALSYRLHPSMLDDLGLAEALVAECERISRHHSFHVEVDVHEVPDALPQDVALCIFRVAQESLNNIARHAHASIATLTLAPNGGGLSLAVSDNGVGFDADGVRPRPGLGRASMDERLRLVGGRLGIKSAAGKGTTISAWVPLTVALP